MEYDLAKMGLSKGRLMTLSLIVVGLISMMGVLFRPQSGVTGTHLVVIYAIIAFALVIYFAFVFGRVANLKAEITEKKKLLEMKAGDKVR